MTEQQDAILKPRPLWPKARNSPDRRFLFEHFLVGAPFWSTGTHPVPATDRIYYFTPPSESSYTTIVSWMYFRKFSKKRALSFSLSLTQCMQRWVGYASENVYTYTHTRCTAMNLESTPLPLTHTHTETALLLRNNIGPPDLPLWTSRLDPTKKARQRRIHNKAQSGWEGKGSLTSVAGCRGNR